MIVIDMTKTENPPARLVYLAHPVGIGSAVESNLRRARLWYRWACLKYPADTISIPWLTHCEVFDPDVDRVRGMRDNLKQLEYHDAILLVGGHISDGMRVELEFALVHEITVDDQTELGKLPPAHMRFAADGGHVIQETEADPYWKNQTAQRDQEITRGTKIALSLVMTDFCQMGAPFDQVERQVADTCYRFAEPTLFGDNHGEEEDSKQTGTPKTPCHSDGRGGARPIAHTRADDGAA